MDIFWAALGLILIFEGVPYFISPTGMKELLGRIREMPEETLRKIGLAAMITGLLIIYLVRR